MQLKPLGGIFTRSAAITVDAAVRSQRARFLNADPEHKQQPLSRSLLSRRRLIRDAICSLGEYKRGRGSDSRGHD